MSTYSHETLENLLDGNTPEGLQVIDRVWLRDSRWTSHNLIVFTDPRYPDEYFAVEFESPLTEMQEGINPFEQHPDPVVALKMTPNERTIVEWVKI